MRDEHHERLQVLMAMTTEDGSIIDSMAIPLFLLVAQPQRFPWIIQFLPASLEAPGAGSRCLLHLPGGRIFEGSGHYWGTALVRALRLYLEATEP